MVGCGLATGVLTIRATLQRIEREWQLLPTKTEKSRRSLPLPPRVLDVLRRHRDRQTFERERAGSIWRDDPPFDDLVFRGETGEPLHATSVTKTFKAAIAAAGLPPQRFHELRHAAASAMLSEGAPLKLAQEVLHATIATTADIYSHVLQDQKRAALSAVASGRGAATPWRGAASVRASMAVPMAQSREIRRGGSSEGSCRRRSR